MARKKKQVEAEPVEQTEMTEQKRYQAEVEAHLRKLKEKNGK